MHLHLLSATGGASSFRTVPTAPVLASQPAYLCTHLAEPWRQPRIVSPVMLTTAAEEEDEVEAAARRASFEEAQRLGSELAGIISESCSRGEPMPADAVVALRALVSHVAGGRGWFVSLLTNPDFDPIFKEPLDPQLLAAIEASPDPNLKLLTMNLAMPTATELVHKANGNEDLAAASRLTRDRSRVLLAALLPRMRGLVEEVQNLRSAVEPWPTDEAPPEEASAEWVEFTRKWGYGAEQRAAIKAELDELLKVYDAPPPLGGFPPELLLAVGYGAYALATGQLDSLMPPAAMPGQ